MDLDLFLPELDDLLLLVGEELLELVPLLLQVPVSAFEELVLVLILHLVFLLGVGLLLPLLQLGHELVGVGQAGTPHLLMALEERYLLKHSFVVLVGLAEPVV